ncbi:unnamed protein product [Strongylus vulgaris]|uniref:Uncharacterized protein n=1 Tax=Strongylus vulgaris TaxID=40348 RepID=A0A3P7I2K2_STRVU|nr:unnamed protein product [Strongylus vulgaris]
MTIASLKSPEELVLKMILLCIIMLLKYLHQISQLQYACLRI